MRICPNHKGFTLVELSIVLVVIGILVGLGANMIGPLTTYVKVRETRDMQDATLQSVISWTSSRNTLPNAGATDTGFRKAAKFPVDAWGQDFVYLYDAGLNSESPTRDTICGKRSTNLKLFVNYTTSNVAFAVISRADNAAYRSTFSGTLTSEPGHVNGAVVSTASSGAASGVISANGTNVDIVRWVTLDELRGKIGCQGAPLKIVNNELPFANYSTSYSASVMADGGSGSGSYQWRIKKVSFPDSLSVSPLAFQNSSTTNWVSTTSLNFQGYPKPQKSYYFTIYVRDAADAGNSSSKPFVLTVNPRSN